MSDYKKLIIKLPSEKTIQINVLFQSRFRLWTLSWR